MFGQQQQQQQGAASGSFGSAAPSTSTFSVTAAAPNVSPFASGFGQQPVASGNAFQQTASFGAQPSTSGFGQISTQPPAFGAQSSAATYGQFNAPPPAFGAQTAGTTFGQSAFGQQSAAGFSSSGGQPPPYTSLFGTAATSGGTTTAASMFASPVTTNSVFGTPSGGQAMTVSSPPSAFGQTTLGASPLATSGATVPTFGQQTTSGFPGAQTSARNFGGFPTGGATFGQPMASGVPAGGAAVQPERSGGPFSQNASGLALGFGGGGQVGNAASMFAVRMTSDLPVTRQATLTFGQAGMAASSFGQPGHQSAAFTNQQQSVAGESMFASNAPGGFSQSQMAAGFSQSSSVPTFGQPSSGASLAFGQPSASTGFSFGQPSINAAPTLGQPGSGKNPTFGESRTPKSLAFGQPSTSSSLVFGQPSTSSSLSFGQPSASKSITFGQPSSSTISTFGQQKTGTAFGHPVPGTSKALGQSGTSTSLTFGRHSTSTSRAYPQKVTSSHTYGGITSGRPMFGSTTHDSVSVPGGAAKNPQRTEMPSSSGALPTTRMLTVSTAPSGGKTGATTERVFGSKSGQASDPKSLFALPLGGAAQPGVTKPSIFGGRAALQTTGPSLGVFGGATSQQSNLPGSVFGGAAKHKSSAPPTTVSGVTTQQTDPTATPFGQLAKAPSQSGSVFGPTGGATSVRSLFGAETAGTSSSRQSARTFLGKFPESGNPSDAAPRASPGAEAKKAVFAQKKGSGSMFRQKPEKVKSSASLFGDATEKEAGYGETAATEEEGVAQDEDASTSDAAEVATVTPGVGVSRISRSGLQAVAGRALAGAIRRQSGSDRGSLRQSRFASQEQIGHLTAVICKGVPVTYNNRSFLTQHFSNYGRVQRVTAQPRAGQATIFFADHESAERAKRKGRVFKKGLAPIDIFWRASTTGGAADRSADKTERKGSQRPLVDDEVQAELRAMSGYSDLASDSVHLLDRPKDPPARSRRARDLPIKAGWRSALPEGAVAPPRRRAPPSQTRGGAAVEKPTVKAVSLESLGRVVARTAKERYDVLEERDKLLRQGVQKSSDLRTHVVEGSCPDMCPEKERYCREYRNQLSTYEMVPGTEASPQVDHATAVKEYQRSAADQDEPLAHELRPTRVLTLTMTYLVRHLMHRGVDGHTEWYDFLWNRTRGIRKDITQQDLCSVESAALVEKCARFHIHCAARLCEEEMMTFDPKINDENLTKTLQTLKQMYDDLESDGKTRCVGEAEFRAYDILLNLNEGDKLRQVSHYRTEIRMSDEVKFAVKAFSALNSNNYVRFFKLVHAASYLNSCLMHRYFNQVRTLAIRTILLAYTTHKKSVQLPLGELVRALAFGGAAEARAFCEHFGLDVGDEMVLLHRAAFMTPEGALPPRRSAIIEEKRLISVGEVVNGGPLPPITAHVPASSFDVNGRFRTTLPVAMTTRPPPVEDALPVATATGSALESSASVAADTETRLLAASIPSNAIKEFARELCLEVIQDMCRDVAVATVVNTKAIISSVFGIVSSVLEEVVATEIRRVCSDVDSEDRLRLLNLALEQERRNLDARELRLREEAEADTREKVAEDVREEIEASVVTEEVAGVAADEMREVALLLQEQQRSLVAAALTSELLDGMVTTECGATCRDVYATDVEDVQLFLAEQKRKVERLRLARYFRKWVNAYAGRLRLRGSMLAFPSAPPMVSAAQQFARLHPGGATKRARVGEESPLVLERRQKYASQALSLHGYIHLLQQELAWKPLNIPHLIAPHLTKRRRAGCIYYWKVALLSHGAAGGGGRRAELARWVRARFTKGHVPSHLQQENVATLSLYSVDVEQMQAAIGVCVTAVDGDDPGDLAGSRRLLGTSGVLYSLCPPRNDEVIEEFWHDARAKLRLLLESKPCKPRLPLVVILLDWPLVDGRVPTEDVEEGLRLPGATGNATTCAHHVFNVAGDVQQPVATDTMETAVSWLSAHAPSIPDLERRPLAEFVEEGLSRHFYQPVYENLAERRQAGLLQQHASTMVKLYNHLLEHLVAVSTDADLSAISWPVYEFAADDGDRRTTVQNEFPPVDWNSEERLADIEGAVSALWLPAVVAEPCDSWTAACDAVWSYVGMVTGADGDDDNDEASITLISRVRYVLRKTVRVFRARCRATTNEDGCTPLPANLPWVDIIDACVTYRLSGLYALQARDRSAVVCCRPGALDAFRPPVMWTEASCRQYRADAVTLNDTVATATQTHREERADASAQQPAPPGGTARKVDVTFRDKDPLRTVAMTTRDRLAARLSSEKSESDAFEKYLASALNASAEGAGIASPDYGAETPPGGGEVKRSSSSALATPARGKSPRLSSSGADASPRDAATRGAIYGGDLNSSIGELRESVILSKAESMRDEGKLRMLL